MTHDRDRLERVTLVSSEQVMERGTLRVVWFIRRADGWVSTHKWPNARVEEVAPGSGTVWESRTELDLPVGTELMRVETRPSPYVRRSPLDFLEREQRQPARRTVRSYYRVTSRGRLLRKPDTRDA